MNINSLHYVIAIADEGSFTKAAQKLYISQPSLSQSIQTLEKKLGTALFDRSSNPIKLTYAGEEYLAWARRMVDSEAQTRKKIADIAENKKRRLVVGVSPYRSLLVLPEVLKRFYKENPGCQIILIEKRSSEYLALLEEDKVDLLIDRPLPLDSNYESIILREEQIFLAAPESMELSVCCGKDGSPFQKELIWRQGGQSSGQGEYENKGEMTGITYGMTDLEALRGKPVITLSSGQHMGKAWRSVFKRMGEEPNVILECQSIEMAFRMTCLGMGITLIPDSIIRFLKPEAHPRYYVLKDHPMSRTMAILYPKNQYLSRDASAFIQLMREVIGE